MFDKANSPTRERAAILKSVEESPSVRGSVISSDLQLTGSVYSEGSITIEGTVQGDVKCRSVLVQESGVVEGTLVADDIDIHGTVDGTIMGQKVSIRATSKVEADIHHDLIELEMGTQFSGVLKRKSQPDNDKSGTMSDAISLSADDIA